MIERKVTNPSAIQSRERHCYNDGLRPGDPKFEPEHLALGRIAVSDWANCRILDRMFLYERRIENSVIKITKELKRFQVIRRIELEAADKQQTTHSKAVPERGTDLKPVENMAKPVLSEVEGMAMPLDEAPSLRDSLGGHLTAEAATGCEPVEKKVDLKKQSQFAVIQIGTKSYLKREYDKIPADGVEENKANLCFTAENAEFAK
jgi:hypothetical protein